MLRKCIGEHEYIFSIKGVDGDENLSYEEVPVEILDRQMMKLKNNEVASLKVLRKNHLLEGATWDVEADMKSSYFHIFSNKG